MPAAVLDQLSAGAEPPGFKHDIGLGQLAVGLSGTPNTAAGATASCAQHPIQRDRVDVGAGRQDHILLAVNNRVVGVLVDGCDIAGVNPAIAADRLLSSLRMLA